MTTPAATKASGGGGGATTAAAATTSTTAAAALSNKDFRQFLTPLHPSMATKTAAATPVASSAAAVAGAGSKTPAPRSSSSASASSSGGAVKFATEETKTVKFTRKGVSDADGGDGGGGEDGDEESSSGAGAGAGGEQRKGGKKGEPRVLSSRERSFIQFQQKQALKATAKVKYRDRTKERNQDANPDYAPEAGEGLGLGGAGGMGGEDASASLSIEASKYLGGDLAHTHLVKGLDFALLNKVRQELERNEEMKLEALVEAQHAAALAAKGKPNAATAAAAAAVGAHKLASSSSAAAATAPSIEEKVSKAALTPAQQAALNMTFGSSMASAIYRLTFDHAPSTSVPVAHHAATTASAMPSSTAVTAAPVTQTDLFLPGRMSFDFPLGAASGAGGLTQAQTTLYALPTTSLTSRSDLDAFAQAYAEEHATALLPPKLHDNIVAIFERHRIAAEERRQKRKRGGAGAEGEHEQAGFNVEKTAPEVQKAAAAAALAAASAASSQNGVARSSGGEATSVAAADDGDALMYTVARPPANDDDDDDDDDIFAGAGSDYQAKLDEGASAEQEPDDGMMYSVARPPPSPDSAPQASPATAAAAVPAMPLFARSAHEAPVPQLDARASRMQDDEEDSEDEDDIFGASTRAGDELLGGAGATESKPLTAEQKSKARSERFAEAEYESLFPEHHTSYSTVLDEDDEDGAGEDAPAEGSKKAKLLAEKAQQAEAKAKALAKAGRTPMRGAGPLEDIDDEMDAKKREAKFNAEYSQVALLLKARGVKLNDDAAARRSGAAAGSRASSGATPKPDDDERAIKRQRILKGFQK